MAKPPMMKMPPEAMPDTDMPAGMQEGTAAEEAADAKELASAKPKAKPAAKKALPKMAIGRIAQRSNKVNRSQVL